MDLKQRATIRRKPYLEYYTKANKALLILLALFTVSCVTASELTFKLEEGEKTIKQLTQELDLNTIAGKRVKFSVEAKGNMTMPLKAWRGAIFNAYAITNNNDVVYRSKKTIGGGVFDWKLIEFETDFPADLKKAAFSMGIHDVIGTASFRNLKIEIQGTPLDLGRVANFSYTDKTSSDGKGGWSDQGPNQDAANFPYKQRYFANVPFSLLAPEGDNKKTMLTFRCPRLPNGIKSSTIEMKNAATSAKYIYILHASSWAQKKGDAIGYIDIEGDVKKQTIAVKFDEDVAGSYKPMSKENAFLACEWLAKSTVLGVFVSRFDIEPDFGEIRKVTFRSAPESTAMWLLLGATLTDNIFKYPEEKSFTTAENNVWKALPQKHIQRPLPGTALDLSPFFEQPDVEKTGRVIINGKGKFAFETSPEKAVRFVSVNATARIYDTYFGVPAELETKESIEEYAKILRRSGYNMIRLWGNSLRRGKQKAFEYNPVYKDRHDYLIACLKKQGVYIMYTLVNPMMRFDYGKNWNDPRAKDVDYYINSADRDAWARTVKELLTTVNPYTGKKLVDDPVLALCDCNNEQEFSFLRGDLDKYAPLWKKFLQDKYKTFKKLKSAWGKDAYNLNKFDDITHFSLLQIDPVGQMQRDKTTFITEQEKWLYDWQRSVLREIGFKGPVTGFLLGRSIRNSMMRRDMDFISLNGYHAHPYGAGSVLNGRSVEQTSSVGLSARTMRDFLSGRIAGKPFMISEHGHAFWNKFRYEQGFVIGAYAALNDFDGLTGFALQVTTQPNHPIAPFENRFDPIIKASELLTVLMFRRGDVSTSKLKSRILVPVTEAVNSCEARNGLNAEQLKLGLISQLDLTLDKSSLKDDAVIFNRAGSSEALIRSADSSLGKSTGNFSLKQALDRLNLHNRSDTANDIFESQTKQIYLDSKKKLMTVNTPSLQGMCGLPGESVELSDFIIKKIGIPANVTLASIDGKKAIPQARRLLLIISTNALNSEMRFASAKLCRRINTGHTPILIETGNYQMILKNLTGFKCYALAMDGSRLNEITLEENNDGTIVNINTGTDKQSPSVFYEFIRGQ